MILLQFVGRPLILPNINIQDMQLKCPPFFPISDGLEDHVLRIYHYPENKEPIASLNEKATKTAICSDIKAQLSLQSRESGLLWEVRRR